MEGLSYPERLTVLKLYSRQVIRFVLGIPPRTHLGCSQFSRVNILPVKYRAEQIKLNHMFNIVHGSAPEYQKHIVLIYQEATAMIPVKEIYLVLCQVSKVLILSFFFYSASKLWNSLSPNLQHVTNKYLFKRNVKAY